MSYPELRFKNPWLLMNAIRTDIEPAYKNDMEKLEPEYINSALARYEEAWRPYEERVIKGMCALLDLEFRQNIIDIYAAPFYNSFSDPMVIATKYETDRSVEVITHELIHRLLTDNRQSAHDTEYRKRWRELFGTEFSDMTLVHIPVHAVCQAIFDDVLNEPRRTEHDKKMYENHKEYHAAWQYVEEVGYKQIIEQMKNQYKAHTKDGV